MRKCFILIFCFLMFFVISVKCNNNILLCNAEENIENNDTSQKLSENVSSQLESLDMGELDEMFETLDSFDINFSEYVKKVVTGEETLSISNLFNYIFIGLKNGLSNFISLFILIVIVAIMMILSVEFGLKKGEGSTSSVVSLLFTIAIVTVIISIFWKSFSSVLFSIKTISSLVEILFPILVSILSALGATSSTILIEPAIAFFVGFIIEVAINFLLPLTIICFVFKILNQLSSSIKLDNICSFLNDIFKWTIGIIFTIFIGYLSIKGLTSASIDNLSIKTAKYAIKSYIPIVGGYLSDSYEVFRIGTVLVKNSIGITSIIFLFVSLISSLASLLILNLGVKLTAGIIEPISKDNKIPQFLINISKTFIQLFAIILILFFMVFILILITISVGNSI